MALYTPIFNEIRQLLYKTIGEYVGKYRSVRLNEINKYIRELKEEDPQKYDIINFTFSFPYSDQVQEVLVDMIRHCLIEKSDRGYELTSLGKNFLGKEQWI